MRLIAFVPCSRLIPGDPYWSIKDAFCSHVNVPSLPHPAVIDFAAFFEADPGEPWTESKTIIELYRRNPLGSDALVERSVVRVAIGGDADRVFQQLAFQWTCRETGPHLFRIQAPGQARAIEWPLRVSCEAEDPPT